MNEFIDNLPITGDAGDSVCPSCGFSPIEFVFSPCTFQYGEGRDAAQITTTLKVGRCNNCDLQFLNEEAEEAKHNAICRHLGLMTPSEIQALRKSLGVSRSEFATITRLGSATLARWERGALIQNAAYDQLLYLLSFPENFERLRNRFGGEREQLCDVQHTRRQVEAHDPTRFPVLSRTAKIGTAKERAASFCLYTGEAA